MKVNYSKSTTVTGNELSINISFAQYNHSFLPGIGIQFIGTMSELPNIEWTNGNLLDEKHLKVTTTDWKIQDMLLKE